MPAMKIFKTAVALVFLPSLLGFYSLAQAGSNAGTFGVTIALRTFSEAVTADHRCTHRGLPNGQTASLRISCPATVNVKAIARTSSSKTGQTLRMNAAPAAGEQLALGDGQALNSTKPVELLISW